MKKLLLLMILYCNSVLPTWQERTVPFIFLVPPSITALYCLHHAYEQYSSNDRKTVRAKLNYGFKILTSSATLGLVMYAAYALATKKPKEKLKL